MNLNQLKYFVEVVDTNSISKAAKNLYISQPAISKAISELEKEFSVLFFVRYNNKLTLTDEGYIFYKRSKNILKQLGDLKEEMILRKNNSVVLKVGVPPMLGTIIVSKIVSKYNEFNPNTQIQLIEFASIANKKAIIDEEIKIGFTLIQDSETNDELNFIKLADTELLYTINKSNPLAKKQTIEINDIQKQGLVLMKEDSLQSYLIAEEFKKRNLVPNIKIRTNQMYTMKELLIKNNLSAFLFSQVLEENSELIGIHLDPKIKLQIALAYKKGTELDEQILKFIEIAKSAFAFKDNF